MVNQSFITSYQFESWIWQKQSISEPLLLLRAAYEKTLAAYHPWVVQKAAKLAMNLLPTKNGLVLKGDIPIPMFT